MIDSFFQIDQRLLSLAEQAEQLCTESFREIERNAMHNGAKVLSAFIKNGVSETHFKGSTGYGYGDAGRDMLDRVYADVFGAEDALVRHSFVSGTHALTVALFGVLRPNDVLLSVTGKPYDTLEEVIGIRGGGTGSLRDFGIRYEQVELHGDGTLDIAAIVKAAVNARVVYLQRSKGYSLRPSITVAQIGSMVQAVKAANPAAIIMVDNCYGELVEQTEPTAAGADLIVGSLIKNPGGAIAETGGYIAGRHDFVELCGYRLTAPGMGREVGCTLNQSRSMFLGLFLAPQVVENALKTATFALRLFELLGYDCYPKRAEQRTDIISAIKLGSADALIAFCEGIQKGAPVDSFVRPEPWDMPGYGDKVIMAAGAFTLGASIELSADAPLREPYAAWLQGGITYPSGKIGILLAAQSMLSKGLLKNV